MLVSIILINELELGSKISEKKKEKARYLSIYWISGSAELQLAAVLVSKDNHLELVA